MGAPVVPEVKHRPQGAVSSNSPQATSPRACAISGSSASDDAAARRAVGITSAPSMTTSRSIDGAAAAICRASGSEIGADDQHARLGLRDHRRELRGRSGAD